MLRVTNLANSKRRKLLTATALHNDFDTANATSWQYASVPMGDQSADDNFLVVVAMGVNNQNTNVVTLSASLPGVGSLPSLDWSGQLDNGGAYINTTIFGKQLKGLASTLTLTIGSNVTLARTAIGVFKVRGSAAPQVIAAYHGWTTTGDFAFGTTDFAPGQVGIGGGIAQGNGSFTASGLTIYHQAAIESGNSSFVLASVAGPSASAARSLSSGNGYGAGLLLKLSPT